VPENYLEIADPYYYLPVQNQEDVDVDKLHDGKTDIISLLYSNQGVPEYPSVNDTYIDAYNVSV